MRNKWIITQNNYLKQKKKKKILEVTIIEMEIQRSPMKWEKSLEKMTLVGT